MARKAFSTNCKSRNDFCRRIKREVIWKIVLNGDDLYFACAFFPFHSQSSADTRKELFPIVIAEVLRAQIDPAEI